MDSTNLKLPNANYDRVPLLFLLHEQPYHYRERALSEAMRVVKPGGKIVAVDYAMPHWWNPLRFLWHPLLAQLEPFALDLCGQEIADWLPEPMPADRLRKDQLLGGLYQKVVTRAEDAGRCGKQLAVESPVC
jgi:SAM-dependent methyltransferase